MFNAIELLQEYVRCSSISANPNAQAGMEAARQFLKRTLSNIGFQVTIIPTPLHPIILAERKTQPKHPHIVIYGHYDVQPPEPLDLWETPPFEGTIKNGHLWGRGSADNKGPLMAHMTAIHQLLQDEPDLPLNLTFMIEGEEEIGSPSFLQFLKNYKDRISGDFLLLSDTQSINESQIAITTGLRGLVSLELTLKGPKNDVHSGLYGGAIRNPIQALTELLSSLHTPEGYINIPDFYNGIIDPTEWDKAQISHLGCTEEAYQKDLGVSETFCIPSYKPWEATRFLPTLEYNGITGGYQGPGSKTIIPHQASVKITARLVPGQDAQKIKTLIIKTLHERKPTGVTLEIKTYGEGSPYGVIPPKHPLFKADTLHPLLMKAFKAADQAIEATFGHPPIYLKEGGSIPIIADIKAETGMDALMIGLFGPDSSLHAPNENFNLHFLEKGAQALYQILKSIATT